MKTQIIRLEPHDDVISTRDKMGWGQPGRILIIWPERGLVLTRQLDLILLQRHSRQLGAQLGLVTQDASVQENAADLGVPVFKDLRRAQRSQWRAGRRRPRRVSIEPRSPGPPQDLRAERDTLRPKRAAWRNHPLVRTFAFVIGVLAVLAIAAASFPGAHIEVVPQLQAQELSLEVQPDPDLSTFNLAGAIPARPVTVVVEGRDQLQSQGRLNIPISPASGQVVFTNLTDERQSIPVGSVVRASDLPELRFATTRAGEIAAGLGQTVSLPVTALFPGTKGNLAAGRLNAIEGPLGLRLTAHNTVSLRGGSDRGASVPTAQNRQQLFEQLETELRQTALSELRQQIDPGDLIFTSTLTMTDVIEATYIPAEDEPADFVELSLRLEYRVYSGARQDLEALATALLDASLPQGYAPIAESLRVTIRDDSPADTGLPLWTVDMSRLTRAIIPTQQAVSLVLGQPVETAAQRLKDGLPLIGEPRLELTPAWWPLMPLMPFRISLSTGS